MKLGKIASSITLAVLCSQLGFLRASNSSPVLGQVIADRAEVNGRIVPSGTTLLHGSEVGTGAYPAAVQLGTGQVVEIGRNSVAHFQRLSEEEVRVTGRRGTVSYRESTGTINTMGVDDEVSFSQRRTGQPILANREGVVGVLARAGQKGKREIEVVDASRIEPTQELVIRSKDSGTQEVKCSIEAIRDNTVILREELRLNFRPDDLVIQRLRVVGTQTVGSLSQNAGSGADTLRVDSAADLNPLQRILIRSRDGRTRGVACIRYADYEQPASLTTADAGSGAARIKIRNDLKNSFSSNSEIVQGISVENRSIVTTLSAIVNAGQKVLTVSEPERVDPLQQVMIQSPDGQRFEAYCVRSVEGNRVVLAEELDFDYAAGSRIIQGAAAEELIASGVMLQRSANCCCCCDASGVLPVAWFWFIPGGVAPFIPCVPPDELASDLELPPTPIVP